MAGTGSGHDHDDHDEHGTDRGGWILVVLAAAVVAFVLGAVVVRAVGADGATVAATSATPGAGSDPHGGSDAHGDEVPTTTAGTATTAVPPTTRAMPAAARANAPAGSTNRDLETGTIPGASGLREGLIRRGWNDRLTVPGDAITRAAVTRGAKSRHR